ncbi:MAG: stalk domain-containing protein [Methylocystaceae bacterium]
MQRIRFIIALTCCLLITFPLAAKAENTDFKVIVNQQTLVIKSPTPQPVLVNNRVYVPLRVISEQLGAQVKWDPLNQQVLLTKPGRSEAAVPQRSSGTSGIRIVVDGNPLTIEASLGQPFIKAPGYTMVPLRAAFSALDCDVNWDAASRTVSVNTRAAKPNEQNPIVTPASPSTPTVPVSGYTSSVLEELAAYGCKLKVDSNVIESASLKGRSVSSFTSEQIQQLNKQLADIKKYPRLIKLPDNNQVDTYALSIIGTSIANAEQLQQWAEGNAQRIQQAKGSPLVPIPYLAALYLRIGAEYGVRGDLAFCQAAKETGYWQFTGDVKPVQNNYCGLYAIGSPLTGKESLGGADPGLVSFKAGTHGAWFATPEAGVEAHIQHLYGYATKAALPPGKAIIDPKYKMLSKGTAPNWTGLSTRWAPAITYGQSIIQDYWLKALSY